ncbi:MAG: Hpt domain-containing protein, partial [Rhodospirillaceae bacterium]
ASEASRLVKFTEKKLRGPPSARSKPARYIRYLTSYAETFSDSMGELRTLLARGDREEARRLTHSLRGTSGQVGVTGIQTLAAGLEESIRTGTEDTKILAQAGIIEARLGIVCAAIRSMAG